jgi:hypothetical protein
MVPLNAIVVHKDNVVPDGWSKDSDLYGKFIRGTPTSATEPGTSEGADNHTHASAGGHNNHTMSSTTHNHTATIANSSGSQQIIDIRSSQVATNINHGHVFTSDNTSPTATEETAGAHTHDQKSNDPVHKTQFFMKHSESSIGLRRRNLGQTSIIMWGLATSALPSRYSKDNNFDDQHIKGVASGGSTPNVSGGTNTHQHDAGPTHDHDITLPIHSHTNTSASGNANVSLNRNRTGTSIISQAHNHSVGTIATSNNASATVVASGTGSHGQHNSLNHEPTYKTVYFINSSSIGINERGIPPGGMVIWNSAVADIPTGYQVGDGTNGTFDMRNKYPKGEDASSPGTTGGANTHEHDAAASHGHSSVDLSHIHPMTGTSSSKSTPTHSLGTQGGFPASSTLIGNHNHGTSSTNSDSGGPTVTLTTETDSHTHGSLNSQPSTVVVSIIERLKPQ